MSVVTTAADTVQSPAEYVSDSESEDIALDMSMISTTRLASTLRNLSQTTQQDIRQVLEHSTAFGGWTSSEWDRVCGDVVEDSEDEPERMVNAEEQPEEEQQEQIDDNNNLRIYLDSRNYEAASVSRRTSLRKRNFASTHPYLTDQIHYLGLSNINYINEIYESEQDLEKIVKLLNYNYTDLKKRYPHDDKYKPKNFYSILGKQSRAAQEQEQEKEQEQSKQQENDSDDQENDQENGPYSSQALSYSDDEDMEDDELLDIHKRSRSHIDNSIIMEEDSDDDTVIQVGGRLLKEKSVLRGVLPESAKRLDIYRRIPRKSYTKPKKSTLVSYRKGLAIKKGTGKGLRAADELSGFLYDGPEGSEGSEVTRSRSPTLSRSSSPEPSRLDTLGILSDSESSDSEDDAQPVNSDSNESSNGSDLFDYPQNDDGYESVVEMDYINPMFTATTKKRRTGPKSHTKTATKTQTVKTHSHTHTRTPNTSIKPKSTTTTTRKATKPHSKKQRLISDTTFGRLVSRRINSRSVTTSTKSHRKKKRPRDTPLDLLLLGSRNNKDLLSDYQFSRNPLQSTVVIEEDSNKKFIKHNHKYAPSSSTGQTTSLRNTYPSTISLRNRVEFPHDFILAHINLVKLKDLSLGRSYVLGRDSVCVSVQDKTYTFTLINSSEASQMMIELMGQIEGMVRNLTALSESEIHQLYDAVRGILVWWIIWQAPATDAHRDSIKSILQALYQARDTSSIRLSKWLYPYFMLVHYEWEVMATMNSPSMAPPPRPPTLNSNYVVKYWDLFIRDFEPDQFNEILINSSSKDYESFHIMHVLLGFQHQFWTSINSALDYVSTHVDVSISLEAVYALACYDHSSTDWSPFYTVYTTISQQEESEIHNRFLDVVYLMNHKYNWSISEKMILLVYSNITARRFANFHEEWTVPELMEPIRTRNDIPIDTFFERFMLFLYSYVGELPPQSNTKRLITKLFTSSNYTYGEDKQHFVMFMNRMNFTLLLVQISEVDLKNQLFDLIGSVVDSKDYGILKISITALTQYTQVVLSRGSLSLPVDCMALLINSVGHSYYGLAGAVKLWTSLYKCLTMVISTTATTAPIRYIFQFLDIVAKVNKRTPSKLLVELWRLVYGALNSLVLQPRSGPMMKRLDSILTSITDLNLSLINDQMSKVPLPTIAEELKVEQHVELCIQIWTTSTFLSSQPNWIKLVLQIYPYLGNQQSRDKFLLYFYSQILKYSPIKACKESIITAVLKNLASFSSSKYVSMVINQLCTEKNEVFQFPKSFVSDGFGHFHISNHRTNVVTMVFSNIAKSQRIPPVTKSLYVEEFLKVMNNEYNKYYSSGWRNWICLIGDPNPSSNSLWYSISIWFMPFISNRTMTIYS
ncbi:Mus7/MMS22 family-domain-containing protein [Scheffersomyces amazonensis]|uniref:Mus7/MMS22 family-domain-containing protein n=1 Tax=Scheffersomyces amazonensis TaxID=1078765 RepID=UPI00315DED08